MSQHRDRISNVPDRRDSIADLRESLRAKAQELLDLATQTSGDIQRSALLHWAYSLIQEAYRLEDMPTALERDLPVPTDSDGEQVQGSELSANVNPQVRGPNAVNGSRNGPAATPMHGSALPAARKFNPAATLRSKN